MKKKEYKQPTMKIAQMKHKCQILAGSGVRAMRSGYGTANEGTWDEE